MSIFRRRTPSEPEALIPGPYGYRVWQHDGLWWWEPVHLTSPSRHGVATGEDTEAEAVRAAIGAANRRNAERAPGAAARAARDAAPIIGGES